MRHGLCEGLGRNRFMAGEGACLKKHIQQGPRYTACELKAGGDKAAGIGLSRAGEIQLQVFGQHKGQKRPDTQEQIHNRLGRYKGDKGENAKSGAHAREIGQQGFGVNMLAVDKGAAAIGKELGNGMQDHGLLDREQRHQHAHQDHTTRHAQNTREHGGQKNSGNNAG